MNYRFNKTDCLNCRGDEEEEEEDRTIDALWQFPLHEWTYPNGKTFDLRERSIEYIL